MEIEKEREVTVVTATFIILLTICCVVLLGISIGHKYFWNKYETATRLDIDLTRIQQALKNAPNNPDLLVEKGWIYYQRRELSEAQKYYQKALSIDPDNISALYNNGLVYFDNKKYLEAEKHFLRIEKLFPKHLNNLMILGELYILTKKPEKAINTLEKLITLKSSWTQAHFLLGQAYELKGLKDKAKISYLEALRFDPQFSMAKDRLSALGGDKDGETSEKKNKI